MSETALEIDLRAPLDAFDLKLRFRSECRVLGVFGPSGAGKTTFLEAVAGLRAKASGRLVCGGEVWLDTAAGVRLAAERRGIGYVPQEHLLFPHWNVRRNLQSGLRRAREAGGDAEAVFEEVIRVLELEALLDRKVEELSGGERQRVALGRALCSGPKLLMLDEPLASLDWKLRHRILPFLVRARDVFRIPMLVVSHNPAELQALCDEVVALRSGQLVAQGTPTEVFTHPEVYASAAQEGYENILSGTLTESGEEGVGIRIGATETGPVVRASSRAGKNGEPVLIGIRAQDVLISNERIRGVSARNWLEARVKSVSSVDGRRVLTASLEPAGSGELVVELTQDALAELSLEVGRRVWLFFKSSAVAVYGSGAELTGS